MARVLLVAFSCCPGMGSEAGIGWNFALGLCTRHDVTLLTTDEFRPQIDAWRQAHPEAPLRVVYRNVALPRWLMFKSYPTANIYYYAWQFSAALTARRLHRRQPFDIAHHVNWGRYWMPSAAAFAGAKFVWGPIGAAEGAAASMLEGMSLRGRFSERVRDFMRWLFEHDPFTRYTARRADAVLAATYETADKLRRWGVSGMEVVCSVGIAEQDLPLPSVADSSTTSDGQTSDPAYACISIGRLLNWKGFHLGLRAFARSGLPARGARYAIAGEGPEEARLRQLAQELGIAGHVDFLGHLPREKCLRVLARARMLVHPSLHDSGGFVLVEAMALGRPVVCLDVGGPAVIVDEHSGVKIRARDADDAVAQLSVAMSRLHDDAPLYDRLSRGALARGRGEFLWSRKMEQVDAVYARLLGRAPAATPDAAARDPSGSAVLPAGGGFPASSGKPGKVVA